VSISELLARRISSGTVDRSEQRRNLHMRALIVNTFLTLDGIMQALLGPRTDVGPSRLVRVSAGGLAR
jgi:hypothetical protein